MTKIDDIKIKINLLKCQGFEARNKIDGLQKQIQQQTQIYNGVLNKLTNLDEEMKKEEKV